MTTSSQDAGPGDVSPPGGVAVSAPVSPGAIVEFLYRQLRNAILECELAPDTVVSQVQLAKQFGVSRTPLREVLRLLEQERLVRAEHNRRVRITGLSVPDLEEVYAARIALEPLAARVGVANWTAHKGEQLQQYFDEMREYANQEDYSGWQVAHRSFHSLLTSASNQRMSQVLSELSDHADRYRRIYATTGPLAWATGLRQHQEILDCVADRDADRLATALARHIGRAALTTIAAADPTHDAVLVREALNMVVRGPEPAGRRGGVG